MLDQRAAHRLRQRARDDQRVALDHDVEVTGHARPLQPRVADDAADGVGTGAVRLGQAADGGEQCQTLGVEPALQAGSHRHDGRCDRPSHDPERRAPLHHHDHRRAGREPTPHGDLALAAGHDGQRTDEPPHGEVADAERLGAGGVLAQRVRRAADRHDVGVPPARQPRRVARAQSRRHADDQAVDEIGGGRRHLWVDVRAPGHHARGWNLRYIRVRADVGR